MQDAARGRLYKALVKSLLRILAVALVVVLQAPLAAQTVVDAATLRVAPALEACAWSSTLDEAALRAVRILIRAGARNRTLVTFEQSTPELTRCMTRAMARVTRARWTHDEVAFAPFATLDLPMDPMPRTPTRSDPMFATGFSLANSDAQRMAQLQALADHGFGFPVSLAGQVLRTFRDHRAAALLVCRVVVGGDAFATVSAALSAADRRWLAQQTRGRCGFAGYAR